MDGNDKPFQSPPAKKESSIEIIKDVVLPSYPVVEVEKMPGFSNLMEELLCSQMTKIVNLKEDSGKLVSKKAKTLEVVEGVVGVACKEEG